MRHQTTQAVSFELEATASSRIIVEINGHKFEHGMAELLHAGRCHYLRGWLSEAIRIGPLVPIAECRLTADFSDEPEREVDRYRLEVAQRNGQQAWLSPIWVQR